jgi:hypothetical protein
MHPFKSVILSLVLELLDSWSCLYSQVWFRDLVFRTGVFKCFPPNGAERKFEVLDIHYYHSFRITEVSN